MKSDLVDIPVCVHHKTDKAVRVSLDGDNEKAIWIPLSQCELEPNERNGDAVITLTEQLATDKGLV